MEFLDRMQLVVAKFKDTHFGLNEKISRPFIYNGVRFIRVQGKIVVGSLDKKFLAMVEKLSDTDLSAIKIGDEVAAIDGVDVETKINELKDYIAGSIERIQLEEALAKLKSEVIDIPMYINGKEITSSEKIKIVSPHDHGQLLGYYNKGEKEHVTIAIDAALETRKKWANMSWEHRATIFVKAAELMAGK